MTLKIYRPQLVKYVDAGGKKLKLAIWDTAESSLKKKKGFWVNNAAGGDKPFMESRRYRKITSVRMKNEKELNCMHVILGKELTVIMNARRCLKPSTEGCQRHEGSDLSEAIPRDPAHCGAEGNMPQKKSILKVDGVQQQMQDLNHLLWCKIMVKSQMLLATQLLTLQMDKTLCLVNQLDLNNFSWTRRGITIDILISGQYN